MCQDVVTLAGESELGLEVLEYCKGIMCKMGCQPGRPCHRVGLVD
jgi:hypothetical protein